MFIQLGKPPDHGFDRPLGMLSDCHRRIEWFLDMLLTVTRERHGAVLDSESRAALEKALRYFAHAAPKHTADEEQSLFPRLRELNDPDVRQLLAEVERLEDEHRVAEHQHAEVDRLVRMWLDKGLLDALHIERLTSLLEQLRAGYRSHITLEDERVFPLAERVLSADQVATIGREMAGRRGVVSGLSAG